MDILIASKMPSFSVATSTHVSLGEDVGTLCVAPDELITHTSADEPAVSVLVTVAVVPDVLVSVPIVIADALIATGVSSPTTLGFAAPPQPQVSLWR